ncbi:3548_t:CDS:2 [Diversispora eburnea]|uniref:3548_t:CDS:1 n=1 Tax=Diversispora eburnea TaxID=1213867 RepID=A0A9N8VN98_9GLOM|nr:3548_t:CDS:2 [Diversispora eburnea]
MSQLQINKTAATFTSFNNHLFAFGSNTFGQLGIGSKSDSNLPTRCIFSNNPKDIFDFPPKIIVGGGNHSAIITHNEKSDSIDIYHRLILPEELSSSSKINWHHVTCGWTFTIATTQKGTSYIFGKGNFGELGCGKNVKTTNDQIFKISEITNFQKVVCGLRHCIGLTKEGICYGWGSNRYGQLGLLIKNLKEGEKKKKQNDNYCYFTPTRIEIKQINEEEKIIDVACGQNHSAVLTQGGDLYTFGLNKCGQLGYASPLKIQNCEIPRKVFNLPGSVLKISCGWNNTLLGKKNEFDEIDDTLNEKEGWVSKPIPLYFLPHTLSSLSKDVEIKDFVCGSEHSLCIKKNGEFYECFAWGWNEHGNCGTGNNIDQWMPIRIIPENTIIKGIGAGCGNSWIWTKK